MSVAEAQFALSIYGEIICADNLAYLREQPTGRFNVSLGSPPYEDARTYGIGFKLKGQAWVDWMIPQVVELCRVTDGLVLVNMAGKVRQWKYSPVVEWLVADLTRNCGLVCGPAPYVFHRIGISGSGSKHYHRRDWEPVYAFARPECLPVKWSDNTAFGLPPKWKPGGKMSHRTKSGSRLVHKTHTKTRADGTKETQGYTAPAICNPGNLISCKVGGGRMGHPIAHRNEAPFPESLAERFVRWFCPPGGTVCDPWGGSGTTAAVAVKNGRRFVSIDIRAEQCEWQRERLIDVLKGGEA